MFLNLVAKANVSQDPGSRDPTFFEVWKLVLGLGITKLYTRKNAQVVTSLQTSCNKSVRKLSTNCVCTACS